MNVRRVVVAVLLAVASAASLPVIGIEALYRSLLPASPPAPSAEPLPPLVRRVLWAECGGRGRLELPRASRPFLLPLLMNLAVDRPDPSAQRGAARTLLNGVARLEMLTLQQSGQLPDRLPHLRRHMIEAALATWIARHWTPTQALDTYGARVWIGREQRGLRAGATLYFGQPLQSLDVDQVALLVAIAQSPSRFDPACFPQRAREARDRVLARMVETGALDAAAAEKARAAPVAVKLDCGRI